MSPIGYSSSLSLLPLIYTAHDSVVWRGWDITGPLWQHPTQLGKPGTHSHTLTFPLGRNHVLRSSHEPELMGGVIWVMPNCSSFPLQCNWIYLFSPLTLCQNLSTGNLDYHKGFLICGWLSKIVFSKDSHIVPRRGWTWFIGHCSHSQDWGVYAYYLMSE